MSGYFLPPLPDAGEVVVESGGKLKLAFALFLRRLDEILRRAFVEYDHGTVIGGTIAPNPTSGLKQKVTNNGAFTIQATAEIGNVELRVTNGASAGAITFAGFDKQWSGDALTTTNGHQFAIFIHGYDGKQAYLIRALQ